MQRVEAKPVNLQGDNLFGCAERLEVVGLGLFSFTYDQEALAQRLCQADGGLDIPGVAGRTRLLAAISFTALALVPEQMRSSCPPTHAPPPASADGKVQLVELDQPIGDVGVVLQVGVQLGLGFAARERGGRPGAEETGVSGYR